MSSLSADFIAKLVASQPTSDTSDLARSISLNDIFILIPVERNKNQIEKEALAIVLLLKDAV